MPKLYLLSLLVMSLLSTTNLAGTVEWNSIALYEGGSYTTRVLGDGSYQQETYSFVNGPAPMWLVAINWYDKNGVPYDDGGIGLVPGWEQDQAVDFTSAWVEAKAGDIVNKDYIENAPEYFFRTIIYGYDGFDKGGVALDVGETLYLAWAGAKQSDPYGATFGWIALALDDAENIKVLGSAWDRDGDPIIVGMVPTPEPSSAFLLLFGVAILALRRRREMV